MPTAPPRVKGENWLRGFAMIRDDPRQPAAVGGTSKAVPARRKRTHLVDIPADAMAKGIELTLKEGDKAPDFSAPTQDGKVLSLADLKGSPVVLYFYPKDDTPGCTKEACSFRDIFSEFEKAGAVVLGVSTDPVKSHKKFVEKFKLPFTLLSDEEKKIVQAYGVWGQKSFMGRKYMGTHRVTFLIDKTGKIARIWAEVKPEQHPAEVLEAIRSL